MPTILEACEIPEPTEVNGIPQKPIEGVSMVYTFDDADAKGRRTTQYFEMLGNRGIYHDGWLACSRFGVPWQTAGREGDILDAPWELYNIDEDFSQADDLAAANPDKLKELQALFLEEAEKYNVLPLDSRMSERMDPKLRVAGEPPTSWTYYGNNVWLPEPIGPQLFPRGHTITAELTIPEGGAEGVVTCAGSFSAGWSLYVKDGKPTFRYTCFDIADVNDPRHRRRSPRARSRSGPSSPRTARRKAAGRHARSSTASRPARASSSGRSSATAWSRSRSAATRSPRSTRPTRTRARSRSPAPSRR